jgi:hypothetical protein
MAQQWVSTQFRYLMANIKVPFNIFAVCNGVEPGILAHFGKVYRTHFRTKGSQNHSDNLNFLAREIMKEGKPDDVIVFLDSDAFPVVPEFVQLLDGWLAKGPLVAARRHDGPNPLAPHPLFCATTLGFWHSIRGDWSPSAWKMPDGTIVQDTGSKLYRKLVERRALWVELYRTNTAFNPHPNCFVVYGNAVYHHGAGSRTDYPDVHSEGSTCLKVRQLSPKILRLIEDHMDFYKLFSEGKYKDSIA